MNSLELLQHGCMMVNIERPNGLAGLTTEQDQMLRFIDEEHESICGLKDWWFLQRVGDLTFLTGATGSSAAVSLSGSNYIVTISGATPFSATLTVNGKMTLDDDTGYQNDIVRVTSNSSTTVATINSTWRGTSTFSGKSWVYGQDEYALPSDCDRVSWVMLFRSGSAGTSTVPVVLEAVSIDELENNRCNRTAYITTGTPTQYCVWKQGVTSAHLRYIKVDPFPECTCHVVFGYYKRPTLLYNTSTAQTPELPDAYHQLLLDKVAMRYYSTMGMGAPAGSPAGQDMQSRLVEVKQDADAAMARMMAEQRIAQELPSMDPMTMARQAFHEALGRDI